MPNSTKRPRGFDTIHNTLKHYSYPVVVLAETTTSCNLNCIMCPRDRLTRPKGIMQEEVYKKIVDDIALYSPEATQFWIAFMGEPLTVGDEAIKRLNYAVEKGLKNVNLNTNLVPANKKMCEELIKTGISRIIVSLDAATAETYNQIRCGGDFNKVLQNIDYLLEAKEKYNADKPEVLVQFIVQDKNRHEVEQFKALFKDKKAVLKIREELGWGLAFDVKTLDMQAEERNYPCPWLNRTIVFHATGQAGQCDASWDGKYYYGDIHYQTIAEIWNGKLAQLRERHWNLDFDFMPCKDCKDWQCGRAEVIYYDK